MAKAGCAGEPAACTPHHASGMDRPPSTAGYHAEMACLLREARLRVSVMARARSGRYRRHGHTKLSKKLFSRRSYPGAVDTARYAILSRIGGIYLDCDF